MPCRPPRDLEAELAQAKAFLASINADIATVMTRLQKRRRSRAWVTHSSGECEHMLVDLPPSMEVGQLKDRRARMEAVISELRTYPKATDRMARRDHGSD